MNFEEEDKSALRRTQATLAAIANGQRVFFNIAQMRDKLKLVKENGKDRGLTRYCLTEKGKMVLNFQI